MSEIVQLAMELAELALNHRAKNPLVFKLNSSQITRTRVSCLSMKCCSIARWPLVREMCEHGHAHGARVRVGVIFSTFISRSGIVPHMCSNIIFIIECSVV